jgi:hypothetical protein
MTDYGIFVIEPTYQELPPGVHCRTVVATVSEVPVRGRPTKDDTVPPSVQRSEQAYGSLAPMSSS